ncbi:alpha-tocopherol transfer protein-like [Caerostris extrusa]|uniref:Alpha-tocopherol transfer protein-like n=1 Tax=Caerostris extrusa TaxID=172846 RepID=A0AAV4XW95_CAEEX|nr:alpha-tocopherol transfer protein-like [Caerostris extrusa]
MNKKTTEGENPLSRFIYETGEILPLDVNYLPEKFLVECENNCNETPENKIKGLNEIKKLLEADKVTKGIQFEDDFLRQYLRHTKYEAAPAFGKLRNFTHLRTNYNYLYLGVHTEYTVIPSTKYSTVLPQRCPDGSLLFLLQLGKWNPNEMPFEDFARITFLIAIQALRHPLTQIAGMTFYR